MLVCRLLSSIDSHHGLIRGLYVQLQSWPFAWHLVLRVFDTLYPVLYMLCGYHAPCSVILLSD